MEKVRLEKTTELEQSQQQLLAVEEMAAREKEATQLLREQLDTLKVFIAVVVELICKSCKVILKRYKRGDAFIRTRWLLLR